MLNFFFGSPCENNDNCPKEGRCATKYNRKSHPNKGKPTCIPRRKGKVGDNCVPGTCDQRFRQRGRQLRCNNRTATCYFPPAPAPAAPMPDYDLTDYDLKEKLEDPPKKTVTFQATPSQSPKILQPATPPQTPKILQKRKPEYKPKIAPLKTTPPLQKSIIKLPQSTEKVRIQKSEVEMRELKIKNRIVELMPLMARYILVKVQVDVLFYNNMQVTSKFRSEVEQVASDLCKQEKVAALLLDPNAQQMAIEVVDRVMKETGRLKIEECLAVLAASFENMPYDEFLSQLQNLKGGAEDCKARMIKHLCGKMDFAMISEKNRLQYNQNKNSSKTVTMVMETLKNAMDNKSDTEIFRLQAAINPQAAAPLLSKITPTPQEVYDLIRQQANSMLAFDPMKSYDFPPEDEPLRRPSPESLEDDADFVLPERSPVDLSDPGERGVWKKFGTYMIWILLLLASSMSFSNQVSTQRVGILPERPDSGFLQLPAPPTMDLGNVNDTPLGRNLQFGQTIVPLSETAFKFGKDMAVTASISQSTNSLQFNNNTMADVAEITQNVTPQKISDLSDDQNTLVQLNDQTRVANATEVAMNTGGILGLGNIFGANDINKTAELVSSDSLVLEDDKPMDFIDNNYPI